MFKKSITILICLAFQAIASTRGNLEIRVTDSAGNALPDATITVSNETNATNRSAVTNKHGVADVRQLLPATEYVITTSLSGYGTVKRKSIRVSIDQTFTVQVRLKASTSSQTLVADRPLVDQTSQLGGTFLELGMIEALPTGRSYQSYLQLVPGVLPTTDGNPSARIGLNYTDLDGETGSSRDNFYYIDGLDMTDPVDGGFGVSINSEIIAEQAVFTGGMSAEMAGAPGLVSNVVTKSGSNNFQGTLSYFFQNPGMVSSLENGFSGYDDETSDTAVVFSGPIVKDKLFFLASYQRKTLDTEGTFFNREKVPVNSDEADYGYFKLSYKPTGNDAIELIYSNDTRTIFFPNRDFAEEVGADYLGGDRFSASWSRLIGEKMIFELVLGRSQTNRDTVPSPLSNGGPSNLVHANGLRTQLGGYDYEGLDARDRDTVKAELSYFLDTENLGNHELKLGAGYVENRNTIKDRYPSGAHWTSVGVESDASNFSDLYDQGIFSFSDLDRIADSINTSYAHLIPALDQNGDGVVSLGEIESASIGSVEGNPHGQINTQRTLDNNSGVNKMKVQGKHFFIQDNIDIGRWHLNLGLRMEEQEHFSASAVSIHRSDWNIAPRLAISYDVMGDGRHKVWAFQGRYYDPVRMNMTNYAGARNGWDRSEQAFIGGEWVTYRTRGAGTNVEALFAPTLKTPYTDEFTLGYQADLGRGMSLEVDYTDRQSRDLLEDYDLTPYGGQSYYTDPANVGVYALPLDYFGYTEADLAENPSNYVIATQAGGKRDYTGFDVTFRKARSKHWQMLASYTHGDARGNTNSDATADLQGDFPRLDARVPGMYARQPGSIEHLFKLAGSYRFNNGLELGGFYHWNSGIFYSNAEYIYGRYLPRGWSEVDVRDADSGIEPNIIGAEQTPELGVLDLRIAYKLELQRINMEFFVDGFNIFDEQTAIAEEGRTDAGVAFGSGKRWELPRRFSIGARLSF